MSKSVGVILARLQPIHNGHLELIRQAASENDEVVVFIGSADKLNPRNPIPYQIRYDLAFKAIENLKLTDSKYGRIRIVGLDDLTSEDDNSHDWGFYLYTHIVKETGQSNFTIYYSDGFEIITSWFPGFVLRNNISLKLLARNSCKDGISATEVRRLIVSGNDAELVKVVPDAVFQMRKTLKTYIEISLAYQMKH